MSYSFNCRGASKDELNDAVEAELDKVVAQQPIHEIDREEHLASVQCLINLCRDPAESEAIVANVSGSCWTVEGKGGLENASLNVSISFAPK